MRAEPIDELWHFISDLFGTDSHVFIVDVPFSLIFIRTTEFGLTSNCVISRFVFHLHKNGIEMFIFGNLSSQHNISDVEMLLYRGSPLQRGLQSFSSQGLISLGGVHSMMLLFELFRIVDC